MKRRELKKRMGRGRHGATMIGSGIESAKIKSVARPAAQWWWIMATRSGDEKREDHYP